MNCTMQTLTQADTSGYALTRSIAKRCMKNTNEELKL